MAISEVGHITYEAYALKMEQQCQDGPEQDSITASEELSAHLINLLTG